MLSGKARTRHFIVFFFLLSSLFFLTARLYYLQTLNRSFYVKKAQEQHTVSVELEPRRGIIFDREMRILALNRNVDSVYADPRAIHNKAKVAKELAEILSLDEELVLNRLERDKGFVWVKRKISDKESDMLKRYKQGGISVIRESKRFYPNDSLASHIIGVAGTDNTGLEGVELFYDRYLRGSPGWLKSIRDGKHRRVISLQTDHVPPRNGCNVVLTIDEVIQHIAERELGKMYKKYNAKGATIIVMNPKNGDILALANYPDFMLNSFRTASFDAVRNRAISDIYEPGSAFKIITASAALEEGLVNFDDIFFCENGSFRVGRRILHDHKPHGNLTFKEIIEKSSNIGAAKVAALLGSDTLFRYLKKFGFYDKTGIDLPGEAAGINRDVSQWTKGTMLAVPMGQEVVVTAIQMACALSAIVNGGLLVKPRVVKEIIDEKGVTIKRYQPVIRRRVISDATSAKMRELLSGVVKNGTGKRAQLDGFSAGGKTGTAQKVKPTGGYSHKKFVASFIGFAPVEDPLICIVVSVDEPRPVYYGGAVAAPVFKNVGQDVLQYLTGKAG